MWVCGVCGNRVDEALDATGPCPYCRAPRSAAGEGGTPAARDLHRLVNLEKGMPSVEQALRQLEGALNSARLQGIRVLSLIHGYGSSGCGGAIRRAVRERLSLLQRQGRVESVIGGEDFEGRSARGRHLLRRYPFLRRHRDLNRANPGITVVLLPLGQTRKD